MNRLFSACAMIALSSAALAAQQPGQQTPYQGTSNPPADDAIVTDATPPAKPPAGKPLVYAPAASTPDPAQSAPAQAAPEPSQAQTVPQPTPVEPNANYPAPGTDADPVAIAPPVYAPAPAPPALDTRQGFVDPDGDIVQPRVLQPGELGEGTTIRVRLLDRLSTALTEKGEPFRSQVSSDVFEGGQVLIPAGTEIDGTVAAVSSGHAGGTGSMRLRPETVVFADGTRYRLSRWKRDSIEYGGAVGAGAVTGAVMGGPVGALTGGLIGAGVVTTHLLVSHPQATLEPGTTLLFTLTEPLQMTPPNMSGN
jgi:hypothetical protein